MNVSCYCELIPGRCRRSCIRIVFGIHLISFRFQAPVIMGIILLVMLEVQVVWMKTHKNNITSSDDVMIIVWGNSKASPERQKKQERTEYLKDWRAGATGNSGTVHISASAYYSSFQTVAMLVQSHLSSLTESYAICVGWPDVHGIMSLTITSVLMIPHSCSQFL